MLSLSSEIYLSACHCQWDNIQILWCGIWSLSFYLLFLPVYSSNSQLSTDSPTSQVAHQSPSTHAVPIPVEHCPHPNPTLAQKLLCTVQVPGQRPPLLYICCWCLSTHTSNHSFLNTITANCTGLLEVLLELKAT
jgi:hypothetical protein